MTKKKHPEDGRGIALRRTELGLTQKDLAFRSGLAENKISDFETGSRSFRNCTVTTALKIARALDTTIEDLL